MADLGYCKTLIRGVPDERTRSVLDQVVTHILGNIRFGVPEHQTRATNLQAYWVSGTTPSVADQEFSIAHGLGTAPHWAVQVVDLSQPGAKSVRLEVTKAADARRIYLNSPETDAPVTLLVEA